MDHVILIDEEGTPIGTRRKDLVHDTDTPLHLAFSCHLLSPDRRVLVTRRSLAKRTWPGVWTNSFCGHPRPGEEMNDAVHRHAAAELGVRVTGLRAILPDYRYRAVDASGIVENEICPVYVALLDTDPAPNPDEVAEWAWCSVTDLSTALERTPFVFSPWMREQFTLLREAGAL